MWEQTFDAIRERIGIKCEQCDISLSQEKYYLEVHYKDYNKNTNDLVNGKLELAYSAYFPEEIKKNKVDEYFIFVASEKPINWLDEYAEIEGEGDKSLAYWNKVHWEYYTREMNEQGENGRFSPCTLP